MEYILFESKKEKDLIVKTLLDKCENSEEAGQKLKYHLRTLSTSCCFSLECVDTSLIMDPRKSLDEIFVHYLVYTHKKGPVYNWATPNAKVTYRREKADEKTFREMAFERIETLKFQEKLKDFEDRIMNMVGQYYVVKNDALEAKEKLNYLNAEAWSRLRDCRLYRRSIGSYFNEIDETAKESYAEDPKTLEEFREKLSISVADSCEEIILAHDNANSNLALKTDLPLEPNDTNLCSEISLFLKQVDRVLGDLCSDDNKKTKPDKYLRTIRSLLMHVVSQGAQYWDAGSAGDVLVAMKNDLTSLRSKIADQAQVVKETKKENATLRCGIDFLRRFARTVRVTKEHRSSMRSSQKDLDSSDDISIFFRSFDSFFED